MADRWRLGPLGQRLLAGLLVVSLTSLGVLAVGTVGPHLLAQTGRHEEIDSGWLIGVTVVAVLIALVASVVVAQRMVAPLNTIVDSVRTFADGDHSVRVPDLQRPELAQLVEALNAAGEEVERSERRRERLTADIAHELRTPLTTLQAGLEELRDGLIAPDLHTLDALHSQATRLGRVVADLSELSEAESAGVYLIRGPVDLGSVVQSAVAEREHAMSTAGLTVRYTAESGVIVDGDRDRLVQVVDNLLANCLSYCRPGDVVDVAVAAYVTPGLEAGVITVADDGPGIGDTERGHAFDRRWRGESAHATIGSGLGLPIVQALVTAHGGTVELSAAAPTGTVVRVELPLLTGDTPPAP
jgi:two-component system, OmpR family, sensor histidine kinase BaeS